MATFGTKGSNLCYYSPIESGVQICWGLPRGIIDLLYVHIAFIFYADPFFTLLLVRFLKSDNEVISYAKYRSKNYIQNVTLVETFWKILRTITKKINGY